MDTSKTNFEAGKAVGQAQEKGSNLIGMAGNAAVTAKDSVIGAGKVVQEKAQNAVDYVKDSVAKK